MRTISFWVVALGFVFWGQVLMGGHIGSILQWTSACIVLAPVVAYLFYRLGFRGFARFWQRVLKGKVEANDNPIIDTCATLGFLGAGIGSVLGLIHVMENLADVSKLGAGIAVAFVSVVYGALPALLLLPIKNHSLEKATTSSEMMKKAAGFSAISTMMLLFCFFTVLYATSGR